MTAFLSFGVCLLLLAIWFLVAFVVALLLGAILAAGQPPTFESQQRERVGLSPTLHDAAQREQRAARGLDAAARAKARRVA